MIKIRRLRFSICAAGWACASIISGRLEGTETRWYPSGRKREETHWKGGERHGKWTWWAEDGSVASVKWYIEGATVSEEAYRERSSDPPEAPGK